MVSTVTCCQEVTQVVGFDNLETRVLRKRDFQGQNSDGRGWIDLEVKSETKEGAGRGFKEGDRRFRR